MRWLRLFRGGTDTQKAADQIGGASAERDQPLALAAKYVPAPVTSEQLLARAR